MNYDIIGDIHGHAEQLRKLLSELGYSDKNGNYRHPNPERKAIFVGDFIDRGPQIKKTLEIVKPMVDNGAALAVMGNHEYNALCFHTKKSRKANSWLRAHSKKNVEQHKKTLRQFKNHNNEWQEYLKWFMSLPLYLEIENLRIVHAAWIQSEIDKIRKWTSGSLKLNDDLLEKSATEGTEEFTAIETVLKGVEIPLPEGCAFEDKDKNPRQEIRIRWWESALDKSYKQMGFPGNSEDISEKLIDRDRAAALPVYDEPVPVFFGHYWLEHNPPQVQQKHICCLDYSVAKGGKLVAYSWEGEKSLENNRFIWV
jgi:hypothetical protein